MELIQKERIALLGAAITPSMIAGTETIFAPVALAPTPAICEVQRNLFYGEHPRHQLDVFLPKESSCATTVVLYVHGGGFVAGHKGEAGAPFYDNVGAWAAANGWIGATMNYRLAPECTWPAGADDVTQAALWLRAHFQSSGGAVAPNIVLMGQSAGAVHVASALARWPEGEAAPAGAILLSGLYDLETLVHSPLEQLYFGADAGQFAERSSLNPLLASGVPCLYTVSALDPLVFQQQALRVVEASFARNRQWPEMLYLHGHNHLSPVLALGCKSDALGPQLAEFVARIST